MLRIIVGREHKKFERLFLFSEVAKQLSFTEAAAELGISKGYLSEQVRELEAEYGQPLLVRSTRNVKLTQQGELVLSCMGEVRQSLLNLDRQIRHDHTVVAGRLRITAPSQFTQRYLVDICNAFRQAYPQVQLSIDCSYTLYDLGKNDYDLAFRATQSPPQNMIAKKLFSYRQTCCAAPAYLAQHGEPESPEALVNHQCLAATENTTWAFNRKQTALTSGLCITDNHMLKDLALQGLGILLVPEYLVDKEIKQGKLKAILTHHTTVESAVYLIHPQLIHQSARLACFIQFVLDWFKARE